jgi:hypothetical protein
MSDPGDAPAGAGPPGPAPAGPTVGPRGADPAQPLTQSRLSFTRVSKEQRLEQASARILEASAIAAAGKAAEEAELRRLAENSRAGAAARRLTSRAVRKSSKRAIPIIGALAALRQDDSESDEEPVGGPGRGGRPGPRGRYKAFTAEEQRPGLCPSTSSSRARAGRIRT